MKKAILSALLVASVLTPFSVTSAEHSFGGPNAVYAIIHNRARSAEWSDNFSTMKDESGNITAFYVKILEYNNKYGDVGLKYCAMMDNGWQDWKTQKGDLAGDGGRTKPVRAVKIELTGADANKYDVYYRVKLKDVGWLKWAKNGEESGSALGHDIINFQLAITAKNATNVNFPSHDADTKFYDQAYADFLKKLDKMSGPPTGGLLGGRPLKK